MILEVFPYKSGPFQLRYLKTKAKNIPVGLPNSSNVRQIGPGFLSYDGTYKQTNKHQNRDYYLKYVNIYVYKSDNVWSTCPPSPKVDNLVESIKYHISTWAQIRKIHPTYIIHDKI